MFALIFALSAMTAVAVALTPREWLKNRFLLFFMSAFHLVGIAGIAALLFFVYKMEDGFLREAIVWVETAYFAFARFALFLAILRYCLHEIARHFNKKRVLRLINNGVVFYLSAMLLTGIYLIPATHNATTLKATEYELSVEAPCEENTLTIAVCADIHVGGGARHSEIDQMLTLVNRAHPDVVLLPGDICDSSTSAADLEYLKNALMQMEPRLGIYFCPGNHEKDCREDWISCMEEAGVVFLENRGIVLRDGINLIGRTDGLEMSVPEILRQDGLDESNVNIVIQHRPTRLREQDGISDLIFCGHTHGYQFPSYGIYSPYQRKLSYGYQKFGQANVIVSSGVSEWGYRCKWPSQSEVTIVKLKTGGEAQ